MIKPFVLSDPLHCSYVLRRLNHADHRSVPGWIRTDLAGLLVSEIAAYAAVPETSLGIDYSISECFCFAVRKTENMKSQPLGCFTADARKLA